ncbi:MULTISPECIES: hypothetical protein [unclassified Streptomyces]|uniref:hypothetical protein n=1 Tax=unclassified Streptomyces TaxID=2593676 RepID=UPI000823A11E|nr:MULTISPECIES: hypothetical protein [unclassified Streptomyces]SCK47368.1 hypothetical protein YUWDRAFT_04111 [Streptomyces sp. AmelKG-D3]
MNAPLPRAYWCHADVDVGRYRLAPDGLVTTAPGPAVAWMRESVRGMTPRLDGDAFHRAWAWLGDRRSAEVAVQALRRGQLYAYELDTRAARWRWTAYPVSVLPLPLDHVPIEPPVRSDA